MPLKKTVIGLSLADKEQKLVSPLKFAGKLRYYSVVTIAVFGVVGAAFLINSKAATIDSASPPAAFGTTAKLIISITGPTPSATINSTVTINASVAGSVKVTRVTFAYDDAPIFSTDKTAPYSAVIDTRGLSSGTHYLKATAYDAAGNATTAGVRVRVRN